MTELAELIAAVGFPAALVLILLYAFWRVCRWAGPLGAKIVEEHIIFLDHSKQHTRRTADTLEKQTELLSGVTKTNRGLLHLVDAADAALDEDKDKAHLELEKMRDELGGGRPH